MVNEGGSATGPLLPLPTLTQITMEEWQEKFLRRLRHVKRIAQRLPDAESDSIFTSDLKLLIAALDDLEREMQITPISDVEGNNGIQD